MNEFESQSPDYPNRKPWDMAIAKFGSREVHLWDGEIQDKAVIQNHRFRRYRVAVGPTFCHDGEFCIKPKTTHYDCIYDTDKEDDARKVFESKAEELRQF